MLEYLDTGTAVLVVVPAPDSFETACTAAEFSHPPMTRKMMKWWFNITVTNLRKLKSQILSKPYTVQLGTRLLTNFEINLAPPLLNFVRQAVPRYQYHWCF